MSKTAYKRAERVADQVRMEVADILMRKAKDPRVHGVTVTDVQMTNDLRLAKVYVTTMEGGDEAHHIFQGLQQASGFVRAELGRRLTIKHVPEIVFVKDLSGPRGDRVLHLLEELQSSGSETPLANDQSTRT